MEKGMKILYAPSSRKMGDDLHNNVVCGFDVLILEALVSLKQKVFYLPHSKTESKVRDSILEIFGDSITWTKVVPKSIDVCVSDMSNVALKCALWTHNPSILCLFGFTSISFPLEDKYFSLIEVATHCVYSLQSLKDSIISYPEIKKSKAQRIQEVMNREMI